MKKKSTKETKKQTITFELKPKKIAASFLAANALSMSFPLNVLAASNITGVTPDGNTYNIEAAKVSGTTGFRQYADFTLDKGDIANLVFKNGQQHFVNLVDNQVNINGILNTMQNNAFYNGHAIFVSPNGMIVGASGVLNIGSLTMMAPSQNAYNAFKNGLTANDYKNIEDYKFDLSNENYKSLITNSSGTITINGRIFAREGISAYARTINIAKSSAEGAATPGIFAGAKDNTQVIKTQAEADTLFNTLVSNNITSANKFTLEEGKIKLVTNKAQNEVITTVFTSEETVKKGSGTNPDNPASSPEGGVEKKKYQTTTTINVANGLKTVVKKEIKEDDSGESTTETSIDEETYEESTLSDSDSSISIKKANIAANEVEIEANAEMTKEVTEDSIKAYGEAKKKAESTSSSSSSDSGSNGSGSSGSGSSGSGSSGSGSSGSGTTEDDSTSGYKIHNSSMGMADKAEASISIIGSTIKADTISVTSNAKNTTKTYLQLTTPIWEKWISLLGTDAATHLLLPKLIDLLPNGESTDDEGLSQEAKDVIKTIIGLMPWNSKEAIVGYFSDKMYKNFDGARATSNISIEGSQIKGASSVDITSNADAVLNLSTGNLDSHALLLYGLGSGTESKVEIQDSTISAINGVYDATKEDSKGDDVGTGAVNINAFSSIDHSIDYDSSKFRAIVDYNGSTQGTSSGSGSSAGTGKYSGYNLSLLNNSISSNNNVTISDGSKVEAANVNVKAIGSNKSNINIKNVSNVGENAERSGISMSMLINHTDTKADILVEEDSEIKANYRPSVKRKEIDWDETTDLENPKFKYVPYYYGNASIIAENIESIQNKVTTLVQAKKQEYSINTKEMANFDPTYTIKLYNWLNKKFLNKVTEKAGSILDKAQLEFSGSAIWNDEINKASSIIKEAKVYADNLDVNSNILDFNTNYAVADAAANSKLGGGAAIIVNSRNNTNVAKITDNSTITAASTVNIDAQTQLPMNPLTIKAGTRQDGKDYYIGASFDEGDGTDKWDTEFLHSDLMKLLGVIGSNLNKEGFQKFLKGVKSPKKTIGNLQLDIDGLFNNYAKAQTGGKYSGIAGSVIVNTIKNDTTALIDSSTVTAKNGNVLVNAVNSTVNNDGAGKVEFMITEINDFLSKLKGGTPEQQLEASKFGMGGSVLVQNFTNNTTSSINKSKVTAENGNIDVLSSSEEGYINIAVTGAKANNVAIEGSVSVQNLKGTTKASIEDEENNANLVKAKNVNVKAGNAKARTKKKGSGSALLGEAGKSIVQDSTTHKLDRNLPRDSKDSVLNITIFGTNAMNSGTGVSVGSSVNVASNTKQINALVEKANITASNNIDVSANSSNKKIDVLASGAFTSGVSTTNLPNVGNPQDGSTNSITNDANTGTNNSLTNNQSVLDGNNPNREGAQSSEGTTGSATQLASGVANVLTGNNTSASRNFSASLAGTVEVYNDKSAVTTAIKNAVLNVGDKLDATATKDNFLLNVSGGVAKGDNIGGGAAVNIYSNSGTVSSDITGGAIIFNSNNAKNLNVKATNNNFIVDVAMGVGMAGDNSKFGAALGGSFNTNTLKDTTRAKITDTTVSKKSGADNDIDVNVLVNTESQIINVAGEVGYSDAANISLGAGVAGNRDVLEQTILAQITGNSTLNNSKDVIIDSILQQHIKSTAIAGKVASSGDFSFNIEGALGLELIKNNVSAILGGDSSNLSTINSSGSVRVKADSTIDGFTATGAINAEVSPSSIGVGIGVIVDMDSSEVKAKVDNAKIENSKSVEVKANSSDKRDFVAANLGAQLSKDGSVGITANGIVSVLKSQIHSQVLNGSTINSDGTIDINSSYTNNFKGVTAVGSGAKNGGAIGANVLENHFENDILSEISNDSILNAGENVGITARTAATLNLIPAAVSFAAAGVTALTADVSVDIIKDKTQALAKAKEITSQSGNIIVGADDETTMLNRGGTVSGATPATFTAISGAVNVDKIEKTVNAQIGTDEQGANKSVVTANNGTVSVSSVSTNSLGGTKNEAGLYERDNIFSQEYQDKLLTKDSDGNFKGINYSSGFGNWNMFYNIAAGSHTTIAGTVIVKNIQNNVNAKVLNTKLKSNDLNITSTDYSVKNIVAGEVSAAAIAAAGAQVYITKDNSDTYSIIGNNSDIEVANTLNINAWNRKDNKVIFAAAGGSSLGSINTNVLKNTIKDDTIAKVDSGSTVKASTLNINTEEDVNASRIVVAASGSAGLAIDVSPLINYYGDDSTSADRKGKIISEISNSTVKDAAINMDASTNMRTQDIVIDAGGAGTGFVGIGSAIKNTYNTITKSVISNSTITNAQDIKMNANSFYDSRNYAIGASGMITGANFVANVILNDFISKTESSIENSSIIAKSIELNTNKNKKDNLVNYGIAGGFVAQGVSAIVTTIYDVFNNESISKVANSSITTTEGGLLLDANSERTMKNYDISASAAGLGFGGAASALVTKNDSKTLSYIDAKNDNLIDIAGQLRLNAQDTTIADNTLGVGGGGAGAGIACVNLYTSNSLVKSEILSQSTNPIKSGSAYVGAESTNAIRNLAVGAAAGLATIAADVQIVKIGKFDSSYTDTEEKSNINKAIQKIKENYDKITTDEEKVRYNPEADTTQGVTGAITNINANMENTGTLEMKAKSNIKGVDKNGKLTEKLYLKNVDVSVGVGDAHATVKNIKLANDTKSTISGGSVKSGDIKVNAESNSNVEIESTAVRISGASLSGGGSIYNNNSNTLAQIGSNGTDNTTITANNVSVNSKSTSKSNLVTRSVGVTAAGVTGVNIIENIDKNSSLAKIIGKSDITAKDTLSVHSTINTDLQSRQNTVEAKGVDLVSVFKNETNASTISKAVIEAVDGTIKSKNINLISDYETMQATNTYDATKVKLGNVADHDKAKVFMNSTFESGINSGSVIIDNSGNMVIETAKNIGNQNNGISAINNLDTVSVAILSFFSGTFGETHNTAKSNTYLVAGNNKTGTLTINSYLDSLAKTTSNVKKGGAISVNSAYAESYDTSTLNLNVAGTNKISGNAVIKAIHNATVHSDIEALNVGGGVQGQRVRISAEQTADTFSTIKGDYSANSSDININTTRNSYISKTTKSGGAISVNDAKSNNTLKGNSQLDINIDNVSDVKLKNKMTVKNTSTNTFDIKSYDSSGGVINISSINDNTTLDTNTVTNVKNAKIKSNDEVSFEVSNNTLVDDTGTSKGGGFIAVLDTEYTRNYSSSANLNLKDSEIHAKDIKLSTHSDISAKRKNEFDFVVKSGGFGVGSNLTIKNNLNQTSNIDLKGTKLYAGNDAEISTDTSSWFMVKSDGDGRGFVSVPKLWSYLTPKYYHNITLDNTSIINAAHNAVFNFNSNNTLSSKVSGYSANFAGPPSSYSYLNLTIDNKLDNQGKINAGNLADINLMTKSYNDLTSRATAANRAFVANAWTGVQLNKTVRNNLLVPLGAEIVSNKDIEVTYSGGRNKFDSYERWDLYHLWGAIPKSGEKKPVGNNVNNSLTLNGLMKAGTSGSKKIVIDKNGDINFDLSEGFNTSDYSLTGGKATDGKTVKDRKLTELKAQIAKIASDKEFVDTEIDNIEKSIETDSEELEKAEGVVSDFKELTDGDFILVDSTIPEDKVSSDFDNIIINDIKSQIVGDKSYEITEEQCNAIFDAYDKEITAIYEYNQKHSEAEQKEYISLSDFLKNNKSLGLSNEQITNVITACETLVNNLDTTTEGNFTVYTALDGNKYAGVSNPTETAGVKSCDELKVMDPDHPDQKIDLSTRIDQLKANIESLTKTLENYEETTEDLAVEIYTLNVEKEIVENTHESEFAKTKDTNYSIVFDDIKSQESSIKIDGMTNRNVYGTGNFIISGSGVRVDNYSTRSLIFNDIDLGTEADGSLYIGGQDYIEFENKNQAINGRFADLYMSIGGINFDGIGTEGAHYKKTGVGSGIVINNYYDSANPFALTAEVANPLFTSDIIFNGNIVSNGDFRVFNDSGSIYLNSFKTAKDKYADLISTKGNVNFTSTGDLTLNDKTNIFAGNAVNITAKSLNSLANITAGYNKDLTLTITNDMIANSNLITDPVTGGEKILINGDKPYTKENNIKALLKDDKIHLYSINNDVRGLDRSKRGTVNINVTDSNNIIDKDKIAAYDKYQKITVNNQTDKQLNVYNVTNAKSSGGYYLNGALVKEAEGYDKAETSITSTGKLSLIGVIENALTYNNQGKLILDTSTSALQSALLLRSNGGGLEVTRQKSYIDTTGSVSTNAILAEGTVALYNDDEAIQGHDDDKSTNMIISGDIEVQGDIAVVQDTKGTLTVDAELHQLKHDDNDTDENGNRTKGSILIVNNNNGAGGLYVNEDTFLYNEDGNIIIGSNSTSEVKVKGVIYAKGGAVHVYNANGNVSLEGTAVAENDIVLDNGGTSAIKVSGTMVTTNGNIIVENENGDLEITEDGSLINLSETAKNINISNINNGQNLKIAGAVENYSGGDISITNNGKGNADISGYIYNEKGNILIDNQKNDLTLSGAVSTDEGKVTILNHGKDMTISGIISAYSRNNAADDGIIIENGKDWLEPGEIGGQKMTITGNLYLDLLENTKKGQISIKNNENAGALTIKEADIESQGADTKIVIDDYSRESALTIENSNLQQKDGYILVRNYDNDLTISKTSIETHNKNLDIISKGQSSSNTNISANIIYSNDDNNSTGKILIEHGDASQSKPLILDGSIQNENADTVINVISGNAEIKSDIENYNGNTSIINKEDSTKISSDILNTGGNISIRNESDEISNTGSLDILGSIVNLDGNINISSNQGSLKIDEDAGILNISSDDTAHNLTITSSGDKFDLNGAIGNSNGNIMVTNEGKAASNIAGYIEAANGDISITNSNEGALNVSGIIENEKGKIEITNNSSDGMVIDYLTNIINNDTTNTVITNTQGSAIIEKYAEIVNTMGGDISIINSGKDLTINGSIENLGTGKLTVNNTTTGDAVALSIKDSAVLHTTDGDIDIVSNKGINLTGLIEADKQNIQITNSNGDLKIGSYDDSNDKYIKTLTNDIIINQTNGCVLNSIVDTVLDRSHQNYDLANPNSAYKTLIAAEGDITLNVTDGNIGGYSNTQIPAGTSYDASTRDYTESINVQSNGKVNATVTNNGNGLINIRAKESDIKLGNIQSDGNVLLTSADWKQADVRPVDKSDSEYFNGYSILNGNDDNSSNIIAKNISIITSGSLGNRDKKVIYEEDTINGGNNVSFNAETENSLHITGRVNSDDGVVKLGNIISKHGSVDVDFENDAEIEHITADDGLLITQKAKNLTIKEFGTARSSSVQNFNDMLYPHDDIALDGDNAELLIPKYVDIKVLDAMGNSNSAASTLKIYSGFVRGNNGENQNYYPNGARLADITLMADYIYSMSDKMKSPTFSDRINLGNTNLTYEMDGETRIAKGLNAYGEGSTLTLDILGVDKDLVNKSGAINRNSYNSQVSVSNVPSKFQNNADEIPYYGSDYRAKNVILSVNDYSTRDVNFDTLYSDNAYISVNKDNIHFDNAYVNNFAEFKTDNKTAVVDNERIGRLENTDIQLYTKKTGSFALGLDRTINMTTTAPTVYNDPHKLVNGYHSAWNFVNRGFKEVEVPVKSIKESIKAKMENDLKTAKPMMVVFDVAGNLTDLSSDTKIYSMSTTGALIANDKGLKNGDKTQLNVRIDDMDIVIDAKVIDAEGDVAQVEFINLPRSLANKLLYKYMQANSEDINLTAL